MHRQLVRLHTRVHGDHPNRNPNPNPNLNLNPNPNPNPNLNPNPNPNPNPDPDPNQVVSKGNPYKGDSRNLFKYDAILKEARRDSMGSIVPG